MLPNTSPWIHQLRRTRPIVPLGRNLEADVVVVGGGIAGVATAFFLLKHTRHKVVLLEAGKVAHGATGHNAGQITSYFERPLHEIAREFGLHDAIYAQRAVESAWRLLDEIYAEANLRTPFYGFIGHAGLSTYEQVERLLKDNKCRQDGGISKETILIAKEWAGRADIAAEFADLYGVISQKEILSILETGNDQYIAAVSFKKGCLNSALFVEELVGHLVSMYPKRFELFEESPVKTVELGRHEARLLVSGFTVQCQSVVLCTNGFENFSIVNNNGVIIDPSFHHSVNGRIGYMAAFLEKKEKSPIAISYFSDSGSSAQSDPTGESYFYMTRRPFEYEADQKDSLISIGGPDRALPNDAQYKHEDPHAELATEQIEGFLYKNYPGFSRKKPRMKFTWHGLMGYTPSGVRMIGREPKNPALLYNLGCNGVGILPSLYGGQRIGMILAGKKVAKSIFDPRG